MTETLLVEINEKGARVVSRNIDDIGKTSKTTNRSVVNLRRTLAALGGVLAVRQIIRYSDAWTSVNNQLRANLPLTANVANESERVLRIAQDTRTPLREVSKLYSQTSAAAEELGASQAQVARVSELAGKSLAIAGSDANTASGALLQLTQLIGGEIVQAQEFNSLIDGMRPLLVAVAKGSDRFAGSVAKLREEVKSGTVTSREFIEALLRGGSQIDEQFGRTEATVGQAFTKLDNALTAFIGKINDSADGTDVLIEALNDLTSFLEDPETIENAKVLGEAIATSLKFALEVIRDTISGTKDLAEEIARLTSGGAGLSGILKDAAELDNIIEQTGGEGTALSFLNADLLQLENGFDRTTQAVKRFERAERLLPSLLELADPEELTQAMETANQQIVEVLQQIGREQDQAFPSAQNLDQLEKALQFWTRIRSDAEGLLQTAKELGKLDPPEPVVPEAVSTTLTGGSGSGKKELTDEQINKLERQINAIVNKASPARGAILELERAENLLNQAVEAGLRTNEERSELLDLLRKQLQDTIKPFEAVLRNLEEETRLTGLSTRERQIQAQIFQTTETLRKQGIELSVEENALLEEKLRLLQRETEIQNVLNSINDRVTQRQTQNEALRQGVDSGQITQGQATQEVFSSNQDLLGDTSFGLENAVAAHEEAFARIDELRQQDLISEQVANQAKAQADIKLAESRLGNTRKLFGALSTLATSENKKLAAIGKAAAVTQATIDGVLGVQKALASAPPPVNFALAAAVGVAAAANVAQIVAQRQLGGDLNKGQLSRVGEGSRPEVFRSSLTGEQFLIPPERGRVTPVGGETNQTNQGGDGRTPESTEAPPQENNINILLDPEAMVAVTQTQAFTNNLLEVVEINAEEIKSKLGF